MARFQIAQIPLVGLSKHLTGRAFGSGKRLSVFSKLGAPRQARLMAEHDLLMKTR
jgi:hypothetical protein